MRLAGVLLALALVLPWAGATREVRAPYVQVLYDDPAMAAYAQHVAAAAEAELTSVAALFGRKPFPVRVRLQTGDDLFNAFALPLPRPHVTFRPVFPIGGGLGFHTPDVIELVLRHELTHLVQLTDKRVPAGATPLPDIGLAGQGSAVLPPAWLLEGIAVWVESSDGVGGRLHDARTRGLLWTLAVGGHMPSLTDVSLISYARWPGGQARYLLGGSFIDQLVREHGLKALVDTLHTFQAGDYLLPFDVAWKRTVGTDLNSEWRSWALGLARQARDHTGLVIPHGLEPAGSGVGALALAPDGRTLAWRVEGGVRVATLEPGGTLSNARTIATRVSPESLTWTGPSTLTMAAIAASPGAAPSDLFALNVTTGALTRLTHGAHAHLPRADGSCLLYVRDVVPGGVALRRRCPDGADEVVWRAPAGEHVVGLAVSKAGRIALSLYRPGGVDLALLTSTGPSFVTHDTASELDPSWQGEDTLLYTSDASGLFQLRRLHLGAPGAATVAAATPSILTNALGGADDPVEGPEGIVFRTLHGDGYVLSWLAPSAPALAAAHAAAAAGPSWPPVPAAPALPAGGAPHYPDVPYSPWPSILPFGWLPSAGRLSLQPLGAGLAITARGLDDSARHALDLTVGYDTGLAGPLAGAYGWLHYGWNMPDIARAPGPPPPLGVALDVGAWPHGAYLGPVDEVAYGVRAETLFRVPVRGDAGSLDVSVSLVRAPSLPGWRPEGSVDAVLDGRSADAFGAVTGGSAVALRGRLSYGAAGASTGAWAEAVDYPTLNGVPVVWRLAAVAGYRPLPPVPVTLPLWAATLSVGGRVAVPLRLRVGDGLYAVERLDVEPSVRLWGGVEPATGGGWTARLDGGADLGLWFDTVIDYDALARFGVRAGYADGWWVSFGVGIPY